MNTTALKIRRQLGAIASHRPQLTDTPALFPLVPRTSWQMGTYTVLAAVLSAGSQILILHAMKEDTVAYGLAEDGWVFATWFPLLFVLALVHAVIEPFYKPDIAVKQKKPLRLAQYRSCLIKHNPFKEGSRSYTDFNKFVEESVTRIVDIEQHIGLGKAYDAGIESNLAELEWELKKVACAIARRVDAHSSLSSIGN